MIPPLHLVTDDRVLGRSDFERRASAVARAGGASLCLHLRGRRTGGRRLLELLRALRPVLRESGGGILVNDRVDVARIGRADGVHLPEHGLPVRVARTLLSDGGEGTRLVGRSVHEPIRFPPEDRPDFLFAGTLHATPSHPGRAGAGPGLVGEIAAAAPGLPVIGIGGITPPRVDAVLAAGGAGVAVLRGVWDAAYPGEAVRRFLREIEDRQRTRQE